MMNKTVYGCMAALSLMVLPAYASDSGAVFVMTNAADHNQVIAYARNAEGKLQQRAVYDTEGRGSGGVTDPLQSQGSLTLNPDHSLLYAVNAGSGTISTFRVQGSTLAFAGKVSSGGSEPVAVTQFGDIVYVLNGAAPGEIVAFRVDSAGHLEQIADSTSYLSGTNTGGASVAVRPDGRFLAVVERGVNMISTFPIKPNGIPGAIVSTPSLVLGAFSGRFAPNGELIVTNDAPGTNNASSISSYTLSNHGEISPVSQSVPTYGNGNCWSAVTPDGQHVYSDNSASSTIAGFKLGRNGVLDPIGGTIVATLPEGSINLEAAVSADGRFLYTLNSGTGTIGIWSIESNGALTAVGEQTGLTPSFGYEGLAAL